MGVILSSYKFTTCLDGMSGKLDIIMRCTRLPSGCAVGDVITYFHILNAHIYVIQKFSINSK